VAVMVCGRHGCGRRGQFCGRHGLWPSWSNPVFMPVCSVMQRSSI